MGKVYELKIKIAELIYLKYGKKFKYIKGDSTLDKFERIKDKKKVILTLTPTHGNLGDHAIAYASKNFIKKYFGNYEFIELDLNEIYQEGKALKNILGKDDIIMLLGGGNMGDLYNNEEWTRKFIINEFRNVKIVSLPQTICFSNTIRGKRELKKTRKIYNKNENLIFIAREEESFDIMKRNFGTERVALYPDMVLSLSKRLDEEREGILLCLRNDREGILEDNLKNRLLSLLEKRYRKVRLSDTVIKKNVSKYTRDLEIEKIWGDISKAEVVITDRLHGMIFCAITNTPCIVLKTYNHKVTQSYKWLENQENIELIENNDLNTIIKSIDKVKGLKNNINFDNEFEKLANYIKFS